MLVFILLHLHDSKEDAYVKVQVNLLRALFTFYMDGTNLQ